MGGISIGQLVSKARRTSEKQRHVNRPSMLHTADLSHRRVSTSLRPCRCKDCQVHGRQEGAPVGHVLCFFLGGNFCWLLSLDVSPSFGLVDIFAFGFLSRSLQCHQSGRGTTFKCPPAAALCRAVFPELSDAWMSAPVVIWEQLWGCDAARLNFAGNLTNWCAKSMTHLLCSSFRTWLTLIQSASQLEKNTKPTGRNAHKACRQHSPYHHDSITRLLPYPICRYSSKTSYHF